MQEYVTLYEQIYDFENLYGAYKEARKGKRWKEAAIKFEINLMEALLLLKRQLQTKPIRWHHITVFMFTSLRNGL